MVREEQQALKETKRNLRFLNQKDCPPVSVQIYENSIHLLFLGDEPFAIEIKNKAFREAYFGYFKHLWKLGKK